METLQIMVEKATTRQNLCAREAYGDAGDQGSPIPGETATPQSYFQHSPSLPASGLTEFSDADAMNWDTFLEKPSELPALKGLTSTTPQKQYMGVRVKMPVRELLRKIRLSKGIDSNDAKEISVKAGTKKTSGTAEKKRAYSEKRKKQNRHHTQAALKNVEELDILVEVLQEDLNKSQSKLGFQLSKPYVPGPSPEYQLPWHSYAENYHGFDCGTAQQFPVPRNIFQNSCEEERYWQEDGKVETSGERFQTFAEDHPPGNVGSELLEDCDTTLHDGRIQKPSIGLFLRQDVPAISFFQFQLRREENRLRDISVEKLLAPDSHGNRRVLVRFGFAPVLISHSKNTSSS